MVKVKHDKNRGENQQKLNDRLQTPLRDVNEIHREIVVDTLGD